MTAREILKPCAQGWAYGLNRFGAKLGVKAIIRIYFSMYIQLYEKISTIAQLVCL